MCILSFLSEYILEAIAKIRLIYTVYRLMYRIMVILLYGSPWIYILIWYHRISQLRIGNFSAVCCLDPIRSIVFIQTNLDSIRGSTFMVISNHFFYSYTYPRIKQEGKHCTFTGTVLIMDYI